MSSINIITDVFTEHEATLVTLNHFPPNIKDLSGLFGDIADARINLDMICQSVSQGKTIDISFTVSDNDLPKTLALVGKYRSRFPHFHSDINTGNVKFAFYGTKMRTTCGVAASLLALFATYDVEIKLITTSEVDISILVDRMYEDAVLDLIKKELTANIK